jgi:hypothetical protein
MPSGLERRGLRAPTAADKGRSTHTLGRRAVSHRSSRTDSVHASPDRHAKTLRVMHDAVGVACWRSQSLNDAAGWQPTHNRWVHSA